MALDVNALIDYGRQQLGKPYVWGATGPSSFDCSGLVQNMFHRFGVDIPRTSQQQAKAGQAVDRGHIQPGDLIFFDWGDGPASHVGMYVGSNQLLNAPQSGDVVKIATMNDTYWKHVTGIRRMTDTAGSFLGVPMPDVLGGAAGAAADAVGGIVGPLVRPLTDIASAASTSAKLADKAMSLFLPSNFVRLCCGLAGTYFILIGILMLSREIR